MRARRAAAERTASGALTAIITESTDAGAGRGPARFFDIVEIRRRAAAESRLGLLCPA
jgi:hypothetical protein